MTYTLTIPAWRPALKNELKGAWQKRHRLKMADGEIVAAYARQQEVPAAAGKRRVCLTFFLGKGQRQFDRDAPWESLLDALKRGGLLVDDSPTWLEMGGVTFFRDQVRPRCEIVLEDVP